MMRKLRALVWLTCRACVFMCVGVGDVISNDEKTASVSLAYMSQVCVRDITGSERQRSIDREVESR